jgi:RNA polymerase sigma-70 factor (sigma-E family)
MYVTFDDFVIRAGPRLLGSGRLILGERALAEDMVQEALILVYRSWASIRDPQATDAFAYRTLVRLCRRRLRSQWYRREIITSELPDLAEPPNDLVAARDAIRVAVRALPARQRETIALRFYSELSVAETAKAMRCSTGTVKSQTAKGMTTLRALLSPMLDSSSSTLQEPQ